MCLRLLLLLLLLLLLIANTDSLLTRLSNNAPSKRHEQALYGIA
jgi:hypothetical protein